MRMNGHVRLIGILVLGMLVLASMQVVGAETAQTWFFTDTNAPSPFTAGDYNKIMTKGVEGGDVTITLAPGKRVWFYADQVAACDVPFPAGCWDVAYWVRAVKEGETGKIYTRVGYADSTGNPVRVSSTVASEKITNPTYIEEIVEGWLVTHDISFTVPEGGRLAIEVLWAGGAAGTLEIHCNPPDKHASKVTSPSTDPGYPVPELPTFILFSAGLIALAGYVGLRRKNKKKIVQSSNKYMQCDESCVVLVKLLLPNFYLLKICLAAMKV